MWCPRQNKRIAPLSYFHECHNMRQATKGLTALTPEIDCDQTAIGLQSRLQYSWQLSNFGKTGVSKEYLRSLC
jgi:hypothetical protein